MKVKIKPTDKKNMTEFEKLITSGNIIDFGFGGFETKETKNKNRKNNKKKG